MKTCWGNESEASRHNMEMSSELHAPMALHPGKSSQYLLEKKGEWAPGPVWTWRQREKRLPQPGIELRSSSTYTHNYSRNFGESSRVNLTVVWVYRQTATPTFQY